MKSQSAHNKIPYFIYQPTIFASKWIRCSTTTPTWSCTWARPTCLKAFTMTPTLYSPTGSALVLPVHHHDWNHLPTQTNASDHTYPCSCLLLHVKTKYAVYHSLISYEVDKSQDKQKSFSYHDGKRIQDLGRSIWSRLLTRWTFIGLLWTASYRGMRNETSQGFTKHHRESGL